MKKSVIITSIIGMAVISIMNYNVLEHKFEFYIGMFMASLFIFGFNFLFSFIDKQSRINILVKLRDREMKER